VIITDRQSSREAALYRVGAAGVGEPGDGPETGANVVGGGGTRGDEVGVVSGPLVGVSGPDGVGDSPAVVVGASVSVVVGVVVVGVVVVGVVVVGVGRCTSERGTQV
jgi:hypothetical protein